MGTEISREEFMEMICERCVIAYRVQTGIIPEEQGQEECDCCPCAIIAGVICDAAGIP